jgi:transposase-like protein
MDLRQRIVAAVHEGGAKAAVARRFKVCRNTVKTLLKMDAAGSLEPKKNTARPLRKFTPQAVEKKKKMDN